eukprot:11941804-Karenia_brevis.AAC.1
MAEGMATKLPRPSKEGLDRRTSFEPGMAKGMATKLPRPSKEGLDRRDDANAALGMATKLSSGS